MSILIVGADRIDAIRQRLENWGATRITHWDARKAGSARSKIPSHIDIVVFFTDFLHHGAARQLKHQVKSRQLNAVYCRRAWSELADALGQCSQSDCSQCPLRDES